VDVKIEDAPPPPTPRAQLMPGSWSPQTHVRFSDFEVPISAGRWIAVDREIQLPDALAEDQRTAETQLFTSTAAQPRVSLLPTPVQQIPSIKQSFTPTYLPPTSYGCLFAPASFKSARHDKSTQTGSDMTAKKMEALEEMMKQLMVANEKRDAAMEILLARTAPQAFQRADEEQEPKRTIFEQLEEERLQKLLAIEAERKEKYEAAGFRYNPTLPSGREEQLRTPEEEQQEHRAEHVKMSQIGPSGKKNRVAAPPWCAWAARGPREKREHAETRVRTVGKQKCNAHSVATQAHAGWLKATYSRKMTDSTADVGAVTGSTETAPARAGHRK
jgi:hypothetical protein